MLTCSCQRSEGDLDEEIVVAQYVPVDFTNLDIYHSLFVAGGETRYFNFPQARLSEVRLPGLKLKTGKSKNSE